MTDTANKEELSLIKKQLADYAMCFELLGSITEVMSETEAIDKIITLFRTICAPSRVVYVSINEGKPAEVTLFPDSVIPKPSVSDIINSLEDDYSWTATGNGFKLKIKYRDKTIGIIEVDGIAFSEYKNHYLNLALSIVNVLALAVSNARTYEALLEANKDLEGFSYSVSHDLRAPLRAIDGYSELLLEDHTDKLNDEGKSFLDIIRKSTDKMGQLIDDILAFSRIGRKELESFKIDMNDIVETVINDIKFTISERNIDFDIKPLPETYGDTAMIRQAIVNLIGNAVKFTRNTQCAKIEIGCNIENGKKVYHIKDNGAGFDMEYSNKLFGVFRRLHGDDEFEGTGIGLAIVRKIITKHGGDVWAKGLVNKGAEIYFTLP